MHDIIESDANKVKTKLLNVVKPITVYRMVSRYDENSARTKFAEAEQHV